MSSFKGVVHYLLNTELTACGALYDGIESRAAVELRGVTCKKCKEVAAQMKKTLDEAISDKVTLYTLAPASLDKPGTESVGSYWLYASETVPEQALREVVMPAESHVAQHQAYTLKTPYITFTEVGLGKALARGEVYRSDEQVELIKTMVADDNKANKKEVEMPARKKAVVTPQVEALPGMTPAGLSVEYVEQIKKDIAAMEKPTVSALDAILAQPIAHIMKQAPIGVPEEFLRKVVPAVATPVVKEGEAMVNPSGDAPARIHVDGASQSTIAFDDSMYVMFVKAFKQALREEGLVIVPARILAQGLEEEAEPEPAKELDIWDVLGGYDTPPAQPAGRKSTLQVFTNKPAEKVVRARGGKTDPAIVKAIQQAWNSGKVTQESLAHKYGMDAKKVWHLCNRAAQL